MSDKWYEILDQGLIGAFMMGVMVILISIYYFIRSLFNKAPESSNEPATENQSIGNKLDSFIDNLKDFSFLTQLYSDIFTSESSDEISRWACHLKVGIGPIPITDLGEMDDDELDELFDNCTTVDLKGFKKYFKEVYALLDEKCGYKNYTWRTAFKADMRLYAFKLMLGLMPKKEQKKAWDEYYEELEEWNVDNDDLEKLIEKINEYSDLIELSTTLKIIQSSGSNIGHKLI